MAKKLIAFDLDDTLAVTKSPISDQMSEILGKLLQKYEVCVITGGAFGQIKKQVIDRLEVSALELRKLHAMPTCGTGYYRYNELTSDWVAQYQNNLSQAQKSKIVKTLKEAAKSLGYWEEHPFGEIIEDRGSQITYSALGQQAPAQAKYAWDPHGTKKHAIRDYAAAQLDDLEIRVGGTTSVDVTAIGIDKAYGMQKLVEILHIDKNEILFMGDKLEEGGNDFPVKAMGIDTVAVESWEDTAKVLSGVLAVS